MNKAADARKLAILLASCNGATVVAFASVGIAVAFALHLKSDLAAALVILSAGLMEITGAVWVSRSKNEGFRWMRSAQVVLFLAVATYVMVRAFTFSYAGISSNSLGKMLVESLIDSSVPETLAYSGVCVFAVAVVVLSGLFQGGMWFFYGYLWRKTTA